MGPLHKYSNNRPFGAFSDNMLLVTEGVRCQDCRRLNTYNTTAKVNCKNTAFTWWERLSAANITIAPCCYRFIAARKPLPQIFNRQSSIFNSIRFYLNAALIVRATLRRFALHSSASGSAKTTCPPIPLAMTSALLAENCGCTKMTLISFRSAYFNNSLS